MNVLAAQRVRVATPLPCPAEVIVGGDRLFLRSQERSATSMSSIGLVPEIFAVRRKSMPAAEPDEVRVLVSTDPAKPFLEGRCGWRGHFDPEAENRTPTT